MQISQTTLKVQKGEVKVTFRVPEDIIKELKYKAIDENVSVNSLAIKALRGFLRK